MIVQELRHIQERLGWLPKEEMKALAERLGVPLHRVHEVASFYPLYKLEPPKGVEVSHRAKAGQSMTRDYSSSVGLERPCRGNGRGRR